MIYFQPRSLTGRKRRGTLPGPRAPSSFTLNPSPAGVVRLSTNTMHSCPPFGTFTSPPKSKQISSAASVSFFWGGGLHNCANSTPSVRSHHVIIRSVWPRRDWEAALATLTANTPAHLMKRRFLVVRCCVPGLIYKPTRFLEIWREAHTRETSEPLVPNAALALPSASPRCARRCLIAATPGRQLTGA